MKDNNVINRIAAVKIIRKLPNKIPVYADGRDVIDRAAAQAEIMLLPSVSTEKTGRWEWVQYDCDPRIGNWHCSECRNNVYQGVDKKGIHNEVIYKFCPWCGAKMEEDE